MRLSGYVTYLQVATCVLYFEFINPYCYRNKIMRFCPYMVNTHNNWSFEMSIELSGSNWTPGPSIVALSRLLGVRLTYLKMLISLTSENSNSLSIQDFTYALQAEMLKAGTSVFFIRVCLLSIIHLLPRDHSYCRITVAVQSIVKISGG